METTHPILAQKTETIKPLYHFKRLYTKIPHASEVNIIPHLENFDFITRSHTIKKYPQKQQTLADSQHL